MVDSDYSSEDYKSPKISIGVIMKNPEIVEFIPNHLKTKKKCVKMQVKKYLL